MFKTKPQVKNLSPLRSSDRRKLADQIISEFGVRVDAGSAGLNGGEDVGGGARPPETQSNLRTLSSVRNLLLPENCSSARFTTRAGVSGTVYVGAHPGHEERILWLQYSANSQIQRLYPTVYTLWKNPALVPLLHTPSKVVQKLKTGADLMTPGLWGGPPWPQSAKQNAIVAVASAERPSVPVWLGVCEIDVFALGNVQGLKGKAVDGVHWAGDEVWSWSSSSAVSGGRDEPEVLKGWVHELADELGNLDIDDDEDAQEDGGVSLEHTVDSSSRSGDVEKYEEEANHETHEPTTQEIDVAFQQAFLYSLYNAKKTGSPPNYSLDLPIQPSFLVANMIQPHLPFQNQHYTIKKTSWKNVKKFIKHLDKQKLVKSKDRNGGETVILDVDFDDRQITQFVPYRLPKPKGDDGGAGGSTTNGDADSGLSQNLTLQYLFRASSKLVPDLTPSKTDYYTKAQISDYIRTYIENNPNLNTGASSKRFIKLNPFIANNILSSQQTTSDTQILAKGEIARDALHKRVLDDDHLCMPFWVLLKADHKWDPEDRTLMKPKAGSPPKVTITVEKRTGTKTVTRVAGMETFNVSPQTMAPELQKRCASSASIEQAVGGKPGMMVSGPSTCLL